MKKTSKISLGVILPITVILTWSMRLVAGGSNEAINLNLIWSYILIRSRYCNSTVHGRLGYGQQFQRHQRKTPAFDTSDHRHRRGSLP